MRYNIEHKKVTHISILANPVLFYFGVFYTTLLVIICVIVAFWVVGWEFLPDNANDLYVQLVFFAMGLLAIGAACLCMPRWYTKLTLDQAGIKIHTAFQKTIWRSYQEYRHIYRAWYWQGTLIGVGKKIIFIVLSKRKLKDSETHAINQLTSLDDVIKIRYSPKRLCVLLDVLPKQQCQSLRMCFHQELG